MKRFQSNMFLRCAVGLLLGALLAGCSAVPFTVTAMRFQGTDPRHKIFQIVTHDTTNKLSDLTFSRLEKYVRTALVSRGFQAVAPGEPAGMVVEIAFEQEPPRTETRTQTENIYQWQPERMVLKTKQTKLPSGIVVTETIPTKVAARTEATGKRTVSYNVKVFPKRLRILGREAVNADGTGPGRSLWSVQVRNEEKIDDLNRFMVLMVAAAMDYLGDDFSGERTVAISQRDKRTRFILSATES